MFFYLFVVWGLCWVVYVVVEVFQVYWCFDICEYKGKIFFLVVVVVNQFLIVEDLLNLGVEFNVIDYQGCLVLYVVVIYGFLGVFLVVFNFGVQVDLEVRDFEGFILFYMVILVFNVVMCFFDFCFWVLSMQV